MRYPVHVDAALDRPLSRWLWLVKWILVIPHLVVLMFLWLAFVVTSVIAFFAILFTAHYPRSIFEFNVGVMRWSWRVSYYAYGALGTDRYPPFSLADDPQYPARLTVDYPEHLSRGLVLVKWWLLAIPHYIIVGLFIGGGAWLGARRDEDWSWSWGSGGLVGILVLVAAVVLAFTGSYPASIYGLVMGMQRWALRVGGYTALMTDQYPPFRLDMGGPDPQDELLAEPPPAGGATDAAEPGEPGRSGIAPVAGAAAGAGPGPSAGVWTAGRVVALVIGGLLAFVSIGLLIGGTALTVAERTARDAQGFLTSRSATLTSAGYALASDDIQFGGGPDWAYASSVLGTTRIRAQATDPGKAVFIGIAPASAVDSYLGSVAYSQLRSIGGPGPTTYDNRIGGAPAGPPSAQAFWTAQVSGTGQQALTWEPTGGNWRVVVMNADGSASVSVRADAGAKLPNLTWLGAGLLVAGALVLIGAVLLIVLPIRGAHRALPAQPQQPPLPVA